MSDKQPTPEAPSAREFPLRDLKNLDASLKLEWHKQHPNHHYIGKSLIESAISAYDALAEKLKWAEYNRDHAVSNEKIAMEKYEQLVSYLPKVPTQPYEKELAQKNQELQRAVESLRDAHDVLAEKNKELHSACAEYNTEVNQLKHERVDLRRKNKELQSEVERLRKEGNIPARQEDVEEVRRLATSWGMFSALETKITEQAKEIERLKSMLENIKILARDGFHNDVAFRKLADSISGKALTGKGD